MFVCSQVLRAVSQAWANPSAVKHTPVEQQLYVSKALLLSVNLLEDSELQELQSGTSKIKLVTPVAQYISRASVYLCFVALRFASVHAGWHAESPGQQCGAYQAHGDGGGGVFELSHGY